MIVIAGVTAASQNNVNVFANTRIESVPRSGNVLLELQANGGTGATLSLQLPDGDVPAEEISVPTGATAGEIHDERKLAFEFPIILGSRPVSKLTTPSGVTVAWRAIFWETE